MSQYQFDATQVNPAGDRSAVPAGNYQVLISNSEIKPNKDKPANRMLTLSMKILDGPLVNQMIFQNLNILHENPVAQQIAQEKLSAICHAVGVLKINDTAQLHGRPFSVKVGITADGKYNELDSILRADGSPVTAAGGAAPAGGSSAAPAWAVPGAAPAPAPALAPSNPPAPAPAPTPAPAPAPAPTPAPPPAAKPPEEKLYYVARNGTNITGNTPIPKSQVLAQYAAELTMVQVCEVGGSAWVTASTIAEAAAPLPSTGGPVPPWLTQPPAPAA